ncbi:hypothetical protein MN205_11300 [Kineococcus sp. TRM81007]|uniref:hypothetical protein n=1 Tax=Kineococcus sp. TRM81007 TaxID=2925831 RepID=UPI001F5792E3|nr:hypothetical protein [Kineococcus sp. TRM81007]MCI2239073.1 hypothetical protein [Kineococcus sp. TRM81007]
MGTAEVVQLLAARTAAAPRPPAGPRLVAVDGRSGSGKTDLAGALAAHLGAPVLHLDELYPGWDGLAEGVALLEREVLVPVRAGRASAPRRWDWVRGRWGERVPVPLSLPTPEAPVLVVEGVGAGCTAVRADVLVWVAAAEAVRRRRALGRDGAVFAPHWRRWAVQEEALFAVHDVRAAADVVLDGSPPREAGSAAVGGARWRVLDG